MGRIKLSNFLVRAIVLVRQPFFNNKGNIGRSRYIGNHVEILQGAVALRAFGIAPLTWPVLVRTRWSISLTADGGLQGCLTYAHPTDARPP